MKSESKILLPLCSFAPVHWCAIASSKTILIEAEENFPKQTYRNRYAILGPNGKQILTIPVEGQKGIKTPVRDIRIAGNSWKKIHLGAIRSAYGRAAFFEYYFDEVERTILTSRASLFEFNLNSLDLFRKINTVAEFNFTKSYQENFDGKDYRNEFEPTSAWSDSKKYPQVFADRFEFTGGLSYLDLLFNLGPAMSEFLEELDFLPINH